MKGIIVNDFELIIKRNNYNGSDVNKSISKITKSFSNVKKYASNDDFKSLLSKLETEINQFTNIKNKIEAYQDVLMGVLNAYRQQAEELAKSINRLTP